jgi:hypothetical protein
LKTWKTTLFLLFVVLTPALRAESRRETMQAAELAAFAHELAPQVNLFQEVWKEDPNAIFYGDVSRHYLYWVKARFKGAETREEIDSIKAQLRGHAIDAKRFLPQDGTILVLSEQRNYLRAPRHAGYGNINTDWFKYFLDPNLLEGQDYRRRGFLPVDNIAVSREAIANPPGLGDGVREIATGELSFSVSDSDVQALYQAVEYAERCAEHHYAVAGKKFDGKPKVDIRSLEAAKKIFEDARTNPKFAAMAKGNDYFADTLAKSFLRLAGAPNREAVDHILEELGAQGIRWDTNDGQPVAAPSPRLKLFRPFFDPSRHPGTPIAKPLADILSYQEFTTLLQEKVAAMDELREVWRLPKSHELAYLSGGVLRGLLRWITEELQTHTVEEVRAMKPPRVDDLMIVEGADRDLVVPKSFHDKVKARLPPGQFWDLITPEFQADSTAAGGCTLEKVRVNGKKIVDPLGGLADFYHGKLVFKWSDTPNIGAVQGNTHTALALRFLRMVNDLPCAKPTAESTALIQSIAAKDADVLPALPPEGKAIPRGSYWVLKAMHKLYESTGGDAKRAEDQLWEANLKDLLEKKGYLLTPRAVSARLFGKRGQAAQLRGALEDLLRREEAKRAPAAVCPAVLGFFAH